MIRKIGSAVAVLLVFLTLPQSGVLALGADYGYDVECDVRNAVNNKRIIDPDPTETLNETYPGFSKDFSVDSKDGTYSLSVKYDRRNGDRFFLQISDLDTGFGASTTTLDNNQMNVSLSTRDVTLRAVCRITTHGLAPLKAAPAPESPQDPPQH